MRNARARMAAHPYGMTDAHNVWIVILRAGSDLPRQRPFAGPFRASLPEPCSPAQGDTWPRERAPVASPAPRKGCQRVAGVSSAARPPET